MAIKVLHEFSGKETKERTIFPGEYENGDPILFGLADYLVANGHAIRLPDAPQEVQADAPPSPVVPQPPKVQRDNKRPANR